MNTRGNFELQGLRDNTYGLLTVIERAPNNEFGMVYWKLQCVCCAIVEKRANSLRAGKFFTCGKPECRFWEKVDKNGPVMPGMETNCWVWTGATKDTCYGVMKVPGEKRNVLVHVFSYDMHFDDRAGRWVLHHCDNRPCVRPEHIFPGTHRDNMRDMAEKGRAATFRQRLSEDSKIELLQDVTSGKLTYVEIASKYSTTVRTISRLVNGR